MKTCLRVAALSLLLSMTFVSSEISVRADISYDFANKTPADIVIRFAPCTEDGSPDKLKDRWVETIIPPSGTWHIRFPPGYKQDAYVCISLPEGKWRGLGGLVINRYFWIVGLGPKREIPGFFQYLEK